MLHRSQSDKHHPHLQPALLLGDACVDVTVRTSNEIVVFICILISVDRGVPRVRTTPKSELKIHTRVTGISRSFPQMELAVCCSHWLYAIGSEEDRVWNWNVVLEIFITFSPCHQLGDCWGYSGPHIDPSSLRSGGRPGGVGVDKSRRDTQLCIWFTLCTWLSYCLMGGVRIGA